MTFGEKLSKLRKEHNFTQEQLADVLGVTRQSISKWESNLSYPETEKLIKMGKLFQCTMDYLLNDEVAEKQTVHEEKENFWDKFKLHVPERKSEKMVFGMPLYHIGRNAHGFFAIGLKAHGVFSIGLLSRGFVSLGLLSLGVMSFGALTFGLLSAGLFSMGLLAAGSVAMGLFAAGAISIGVIACGALSIGHFSIGALAIGKYVAVGDHAYGMIAIGKKLAEGSVYSHIGNLSSADIPIVIQWLDANIPAWLGWAKDVFKFLIG